MSNDFLVPYGYGIEPNPKSDTAAVDGGGVGGPFDGADRGRDNDSVMKPLLSKTPLRRITSGGGSLAQVTRLELPTFVKRRTWKFTNSYTKFHFRNVKICCKLESKIPCFDEINSVKTITH